MPIETFDFIECAREPPLGQDRNSRGDAARLGVDRHRSGTAAKTEAPP